ncbi:MAG: hypothetical protein ACAI38_25940 [Myxococcota bacterium]
MSSRPHILRVQGVPNPQLELAVPGGPGESAPALSMDPELLRSPAYLLDYRPWAADNARMNERGSPLRAYRDLVFMVYDHYVSRPYEQGAYYPALQERLDAFRHHFGNGSAATPVPERVTDEAGVYALAAALSDAQFLGDLRTRHGMTVRPIIFPNSPHTFDLQATAREQSESDRVSFFNLPPRDVRWIYTTPVMNGVDSYYAGFFQREFPGHFAMGPDGVVIDDVFLRQRVLRFAETWKFGVRPGTEGRVNPLTNTDAIQLRGLREAHRADLDTAYDRLLAQVASAPATHARFLRERAAGDYPIEVYQHVAYAHFRDIVRTQSGFYAASLGQRRNVREGELALESVLAVQRYSPSWRFAMLDLTTQSQPFSASAIALDQMVNPRLALGYMTEQVRAILGDGAYAGDRLFERIGYAVAADELFLTHDLREQHPAAYQALLSADGRLRRLSELTRDEQLAVLRTYLSNGQGGYNAISVVRLRAVFAARIREEDARALADAVHRVRVRERDAQPT